MKIEVGKVLKAQGIKGELKLSCFLDDPKMLVGIKKLYLGIQLHYVQSVRVGGQFCYVLFKDISGRNLAETYQNKPVFADKEDVKLADGRYYVEDLLGCEVVLDDQTTVGKVIDIEQYGSADVYTTKQANVVTSFPFLKDMIVSIDVAAKKIVLK
ncbi:MAG: 16S rRNA processing protein RimM, partial [Clostridia bacterium]|nr:16S rRNA processing protein RimM [Clostridia bacterium]